MVDKVHLHKDYNTSFCDKDAAHIPMTHTLENTTCKECRKNGISARKAELEGVVKQAEDLIERSKREIAELPTK